MRLGKKAAMSIRQVLEIFSPAIVPHIDNNKVQRKDFRATQTDQGTRR